MKAFFAQALLLGAAIAAPGDVARRAACNADNCARAVFGTATKGQSARGSADCSSYLRSTVSPCTVTATATATTTATVSTTVSTTVSVTNTATTTTSPTTTITAFTTVTTSPTVTVTTTSTSTATVTPTPLKKREDHLNQKRVTSSCPATTTPSNIPTYYSSCSGSVRFSSACSCAGITPTVTTLATPTSTTTTTKTVTQTNTATSSISSTVTVTVTATDVQTFTSTSTITNTATTATVTATGSTTVTVTASPTATCGPTVPARNQGECGADEYCCDANCNNICTSPAYICYQACDPGQCANDTPGNPQVISYYGDGTCYATRQCSCPASKIKRVLMGLEERGSMVQTVYADKIVWRDSSLNPLP